MGAYTDLSESSVRERERVEKREQLKALLQEVPLHDVLIAVRDHVQLGGVVAEPRARAIITRSIEDAIVWHSAVESMVLVSATGS